MIITPKHIQDAIAQRLAETFPGEAVYTDLAPKNFARPSNMVENAAITLDALSPGAGSVALSYSVKITTFSSVDAVHASHLPTLDARAMMILGIFAAGYLRVQDRALTVTALRADTAMFDAAEVTLTLTLNIAREAFCPDALLPAMQELHINETT